MKPKFSFRLTFGKWCLPFVKFHCHTQKHHYSVCFWPLCKPRLKYEKIEAYRPDVSIDNLKRTTTRILTLWPFIMVDGEKTS